MAADLATQLSDVAERYVNNADVEVAWAIRAAEAAAIHMNLLLAVADTRQLRLNRHHEAIYRRFREHFPTMDVESITESDLKDDANKVKWRQFCEHFAAHIEDYNLGTLMRMRADGIYNEANTLVTTKITYLAIEGARNCEGVNEKHKATIAQAHRQATAEAAAS